VETLTQRVQSIDWGHLYRRLEKEFYPERFDKEQTFPQWLQENVKIEYFSPSILVRSVPEEDDYRKERAENGYVYDFFTLGKTGFIDSGDLDSEAWNLQPPYQLTTKDWQERETEEMRSYD
jgi:hypothetical protein